MIAVLEEPATRYRTASLMRALIVDDSAIDRRRTGGIVERADGLAVSYACNGREALAVQEEETVAVVLADMQLPEMDGLQLVRELRKRYPAIPVVLTTASGSEEIAKLALRAGAAGYVPKQTLARDLVDTLNHILGMVPVDLNRQRVLSGLERRESYFSLENDPELIGALVDLLLRELAGMNVGDETVRMQVGVALQEALSNALYHGNLEVSSDLRQYDERQFYALATERRSLRPYQQRRVHVRATVDRVSATFVIRDDGPGFDVSRFDHSIGSEDLMRIGGRGLLLIRRFMDEVTYNATGNELTLVKRCGEAGPCTCTRGS